VRLKCNDTAPELTKYKSWPHCHRRHDSFTIQTRRGSSTQGTWLTSFLDLIGRHLWAGPRKRKKSQHATKCSVYADCRTDFWEFLPDARATHWLAPIRRHLATVIMICKIRICVSYTTQTLWFIITLISFYFPSETSGWRNYFVEVFCKSLGLCCYITKLRFCVLSSLGDIWLLRSFYVHSTKVRSCVSYISIGASRNCVVSFEKEPIFVGLTSKCPSLEGSLKYQ